MTCIIGYVYKDTVYMAGDSAASDSSDLYVEIRRDPKVFKRGLFLIGFALSFRMGQLLMTSHFKVPKQKRNQSDYDFMITSFVDAIRECLKKGGCLEVSEAGGECGNVFLVGYKNKLYEIEEDFQVAEVYDNYTSCGSGKKVALGAMSILSEDKNLSPEEKLIKSLEISAKYTLGVSPPFNIVSMKKSEDSFGLRRKSRSL